MSPVLSSQSMVLATAMAVSGTVILFALRLQKSPSNSPPLLSRPLPLSCIISPGDEKKKEKKKKKRVHFAEDVVDPIGNSDLYRKKLLHGNSSSNNNCESKSIKNSNSNSSTVKRLGGKVKEMPENRVALYNGILRDRVFHRVAYSC